MTNALEALEPYQVDERPDGRWPGQGQPSSCTACRPTAARRSPTEVIDGPRSLVWDEAENRIHAQKSILAWCFGKI